MLRASSLGLRLPQASPSGSPLSLSRCCLNRCHRLSSTRAALTAHPQSANVNGVRDYARLDPPPHLVRRTEDTEEMSTSQEDESEDYHAERVVDIPSGWTPSPSPVKDSVSSTQKNASTEASDNYSFTIELCKRFKESDMNDPLAASKYKGLIHHSENALAFWDRTSVPIQTPRYRRVLRVLEGQKIRRTKWLEILATTHDPQEAWQAYTNHGSLSATADTYDKIPYAHLHRLARLIASIQPRTRNVFLQMYSVISTLRKTGGHVHLWEWNTLMDCAGKGTRKTQYVDYQRSLQVLHDIIAEDVQPDIYSYTILLSIAGRITDSAPVNHALRLFKASKIPPNRVTHLALMRYFTNRNDKRAIRRTVALMREQDIPLNIDAVNSFMWAFARNGQVEFAWNVYRVLRYHLDPKTDAEAFADESADIETVNAMVAREGLFIPDDIIPDQVTYHILIQSLAYRGDIIRSVRVFADMLSAYLPGVDPEEGEPDAYPPTLTAFRSIFYGFAKFGRPSVFTDNFIPVSPVHEPFISESAWNLENLQLVFNNFLELPDDVFPSDRVVWWIIVAFIKTSDADIDKLRDVWVRLHERYPADWSERVRTFVKIISRRNTSQRHNQKALLDLIRRTL